MHTSRRALALSPSPGRRRMSRARRARLLTTIAIAISLALIATVAIAVNAYRRFDDNIVRSDFSLPLVDHDEHPREQNILIMGLDSRRDQNGDPLPDEVYRAIRAGEADDGGYNANVLILLHIPEDRSQAVGISIPRDDYVEIAGAPLGVTHSKIKEAYGLALQERLNELHLIGDLSEAEAYQEARAAGRRAQVETVSRFLGNVRIDHFVEMTMGGFYYIAEAVAPITVCLNHATEDVYSGADFPAGVQELDAQQAMSFVRQRRDTGDDGPFLTDLDRSRRQQAFLVALANRLKERSTLANPRTVASLAEVTQSHVALDTDFDVLGFLEIARETARQGVRFVTLPIVDFGMIDGAYVNLVDVDEVQGVVGQILDGTYFDPVPDPDDASDANGPDGLAEEAESAESAERDADPVAGVPRAATVYESWDEPIQAGALPCVN